MRHLHKPTLNTIECFEIEKPRTAQTTRNLGNRVRTFGAVQGNFVSTDLAKYAAKHADDSLGNGVHAPLHNVASAEGTLSVKSSVNSSAAW